MARALVTGGTGFTGVAHRRRARRAGWEVRTLDVNPPPDRRPRVRARRHARRRRHARGRGGLRGGGGERRARTRHALERGRVPLGERGRLPDHARRRRGGGRLRRARVLERDLRGAAQLPTPTTAPLAAFDPYGRSKAEAERMVASRRRGGAGDRQPAAAHPGRRGPARAVRRDLRPGAGGQARARVRPRAESLAAVRRATTSAPPRWRRSSGARAATTTWAAPATARCARTSRR